MAKDKRIVVLGLGSFGAVLAKRLNKNGRRVTGVDMSRERVEELKEDLYEAVIADVTQREALEHLALDDAAAVVIALGEDIAQSLLATLHVKELGAKQIIVKGVTAEHGRLLKQLGVDRVVFPEVEMATQLAESLTWPNVLDLLNIDHQYSIMEVAVPESCVGETIRSADLRRRCGAWIVGIKDVMSGKLEMFPDPEFRFGEDQILLVIGKESALQSLRELK